MSRNYKEELINRTEFISETVKKAGADGIVFGNSGGKDSALVGILCKKACKNTVGFIMPCETKRNFSEDKADALLVSKKYGIQTLEADISRVKRDLVNSFSNEFSLSDQALMNIAPRIRMTLLYSAAQSRNSIVAGTGNRSEEYVGYFTKWGDGAYDFNPISDLTATEVLEFLEFLDAPYQIIKKAPSAGLFDGQTDESEMGFSYNELDLYLTEGKGDPEIIGKIEKMHRRSEHKRNTPPVFSKGMTNHENK